jgi:hypothetical protein
LSNLPRIALAAVVATVALVFLASVLFPPVGERDAAADETPEYPLSADKGTTKLLPGPLQMEDVFQRKDVPDASAFNNLNLNVLAEDGAPLANAEVLVFITDDSRKSPTVSTTTDLDGILHVKWLPDGNYRLEVNHELYFSSAQTTFDIPAQEPVDLKVTLKLGAKLSGELRRTDGTPFMHGVIRLINAQEELDHVLTADAKGNFHSKTLVPGLWRAEWAKHVNATAEPALRFDAALAPGNHRRLRFSLPTADLVGDVEPSVAEIFE